MIDEELLKQHGDRGTFVIRIRRHGIWQGNVTWLDKNDTMNFRSAFELLKIIDSALDQKEA